MFSCDLFNVWNRKRVNLIPFGGNGIKGEQGIHAGRVATERPGEGAKQGLESAVASMLISRCGG